MTGEQVYTDTLVVIQCCDCGVAFGMTRDFNRRRHEDGGWFYCPAGHRQRYTVSEVQRLKKANEQLEREKQWARDDAEFERKNRRRTELSLRATKAVVTRTKKRIANGVCPCCKRHFGNLEKHMKGEHPDYVPTEEPKP